jgi:hypothetical protein
MKAAANHLKRKSCPWCGGRKLAFVWGVTPDERERNQYWVACLSSRCGSTGPRRTTERAAADAWNRPLDNAAEREP